MDFNAADVATLLRSSKIRDRNDGVELLETALRRKQDLPGKHLNLLVLAIFELIQRELELLTHNETPAAAQRLSRASDLIRSLTELSVTARTASGPVLDSKYKAKTLINIVLEIIRNQNERTLVVFSNCLQVLLKQQFVRDHLSYDEWMLSYNHCTKMLGSCQPSQKKPFLDCLVQLIAENTTNYVEVYDLDIDALFDVLVELAAEPKIDQRQALGVLRITNKLIVMFCCQDFSTVRRYIKLGFRILSKYKFNFKDSSALNEQMVVFLNLAPVHELSLFNWTNSDDDKHFVSGVASVLDDYITGISSSGYFPNPSDFGSFVDYNEDIDLFRLHTTYLKQTSPIRWLLFSGLSTLTRVYYSLTKLNKESSDNNDIDFTIHKKRKLIQAFSVADLADCLSLYTKLIQSENKNLKLCGLLLVHFHLELSLEDDLTATPSSVFGQHSILLGSIQSLFELVASSFSIVDLHFWVILVIRSFSFRFTQSRHAVELNVIGKILLLLLQHLNREYICDQACLAFCSIVDLISVKDINLSQIFDQTLTSQVENVVNLAEVSGPSKISDSSFQFWFALLKVHKWLSLKAVGLQDRIKEWFLAKWDTKFNPSSIDFCSDFSSICEFLKWLAAGSIPESSVHDYSASYKGPLNTLKIAFCQFEKLMVFKTPQAASLVIHSKEVVSFEKMLNIGFILQKILDLQESVIQTGAKHTLKLASLVYTLGYNLKETNESFFNTATYTMMNLIRDSDPINLSEWIEFMLSIVGNVSYHETNISDFISETLISISKRARSVTPQDREESYHQSDMGDFDAFNMLENEFSGSKRIDHELKTIEELSCCTYPATDAVKAIIKFHRTSGATVNQLVHEVFTFIDTIESSNTAEALYCFYILLSAIREDEARDLDITSCTRLVRALGEGPLSSTLLDRAELTIFSITRLLNLILPVLSQKADEALINDCVDLAQWLLQIGKRGCFLTDNGCLEYMKLLLTLMSRKDLDQLVIVTGELESEFLSLFLKAKNFIRTGLIDSINSYLLKIDHKAQMNFYLSLTTSFLFSADIEIDGLVYCVFMGSLHTLNLQVRTAIIFNLLEFCSLENNIVGSLKVVINNTFRHICEDMHIQGPQQLFKIFKIEILRSWWVHHNDFDNFPLFIFNYELYDDFYETNREYMASIFFSLNLQNKDSKIWKSICKNESTIDLVERCLSLTIPLAYIKGGYRNEIHPMLTKALKDKYHQVLRENLLLIIMKALELTFFGDEKAITLILDNSITYFSFGHDLSKVLEPDSRISISFNSGYTLVKNLLKKFYSDDDFWVYPNLFFLMKHAISSVQESISENAKILNVRKIKFLLAMGHNDIFHFPILQMILTRVLPYISDPNLYYEVCGILMSLHADMWAEKLPDSCKDLIILLLYVLSKSKQQLLDFLDVINGIISESKLPVPLCTFLRFVVSSLRNICKPLDNSMQVDSLECLEFVNDQESVAAAKINDSYEYLLQLMSFCFEYASPDIEATGSSIISEVLLVSNVTQMSFPFKKWTAETLALYYLKHGTNKINEILKLEEVPDVTEQTNHLKEAIKMAIQYLNADDIVISKYADVTVGIIRANDEILFESLFGESCAHLCPLPGSASWIVNDYRANNVSSTKASKTPDSWALIKCQSMLEIIRMKIPALLPLQSFLAQVPGCSLEIMPFLICLIIEKFFKVQDIAVLFEEFVNNEYLHTKQVCQTFLRTCLLIRHQANNKVQSFKTVYLALDVLGFIDIACKFNIFESSLMLLEETLRNDQHQQKAQWYEMSCTSLIFQSIDNEDIIHGLPEQTTLDFAIQKIKNTTELSGTIEFDFARLDSSLLLNGKWQRTSLVESMMQEGLVGAASVIGSSINVTNEDQTFEWSWKLNQWNLPAPSSPQTKSQFIYKSLTDFQRNIKLVNRPFDSSILVDALQSKSVVTSELMSSKEIIQRTKGNLELMGILFGIGDAILAKSWDDVNRFNSLSAWFDDGLGELSDDILFARFVTFQLLSRSLSKDTDITKFCLFSLNELTRYNNYSRVSGKEQKMVNSAVLIDEISKTKFSNMASKDLEQNALKLAKFQSSKALWSQNHTGVAVSMLKDLQESEIEFPIEQMSVPNPMFKAILVGWMADSRQELSSKIMDRYVLPTAELILEYDPTTKAKVFELLARFCERQSRSRNLNDLIEKLEKQVNMKKSEINELKSHYSTVSVPVDERKVVQKYYSKLKAQYTSELNDLEEIRNTKLDFSKKAIEYYLVGISNCDYSDESIDKFFSLWLEHPNFDDLNEVILKLIANVPTFRLVSWSSQLCSRLSSEESLFQDLLKVLIKKLCKDHPYHSLYHLVSLKKQEEVSESSNQLLMSKAVVAGEIWDSLKTLGSKYTRNYLSSIERFSSEALSLASQKMSRGKVLNLSTSALGTYWVNELPKIPPPTLTFAPRPSANYENVVTFKRTIPQVTIASSGLSLPKIAKFVLSDGTEHKAIFKYGTDDLRQDAIMEQVFEKVNIIFQKDRETMRRKLRVRTYKIVPIGPKAGVIEFVPNSMALIDIIKPYHSKKDKMKLEKARELMKESQTQDRQRRIKVYEKICSQIGPQLGCFFFDTFLTPREWFSSRVQYSHGMATSSMVGHILGLGDRHCNNILLDKSSGEPIHIDLGVAFDQGRRLPIPETVPFRLTRDLVDGLGISGVEGIFKRNSEHTFRVLRQNQDHIVAILDILRWDPLYSWNLSPLRKQYLQQDGVSNVIQKRAEDDTSEAGQAIQMVSDKISANGLSVEAAVRELIQEATNPENLALIYCGWCPFY